MTTHNRTAVSLRWHSFLFIAASLLLCSSSVFAQESLCKSKGGQVKVVYPELARRMKISGVVRLQIQLTASGSVRDSKVLGGNPVLASAAQQAVKQARFEGSESCVAIFEFKE
jgi:TonB family protein